MIVHAHARQLPFAENSIDMIWTDPPYLKKFLPCYEWLAEEAARILKPGGFVFCMAGGFYLNKIYGYFERQSALEYFWEFHHRSNGDAPYIWQKFIIAKTKVILAYSKGPGQPRIKSILSMFEDTTKSKGWHHWGQDVESARYYIDCFSKVGDLVLDPFVGGGTTAVACELIGRRWIGSDIDPKALQTTSIRLGGAEIPYDMPLFDEVPA
jgi:DNA modification methylase